MSKLPNSVEIGNVFTEADSWWIDYEITCPKCQGKRVLEIEDPVYVRYEDNNVSLAIPCNGKRCNNNIWVMKSTIENWKHQKEIDAAVAEALKNSDTTIESV